MMLNFSRKKIITNALILPLFFLAVHTYGVTHRSGDLTTISNSVFDSITLNSFIAQQGRDAFKPAKIYIAPASASFSKQWIKDYKKDTSRSYRKKTLKRYASLLHEQVYIAASYIPEFKIVDNSKHADLVFTPKLSKVFIYGPDDKLGNQYVLVAGMADFELEITTAENNQLLALYKDRSTTRINSRQATRQRNYLDFKILLEQWSVDAIKHFAMGSDDIDEQRTRLAGAPN